MTGMPLAIAAGLIASQTAIASPDVFDLILNAGIFAKVILGVLLVLSLLSWAVTLHKSRQYRKLVKTSYEIRALVESGTDLRGLSHKLQRGREDIFNLVFDAGYNTLAAAVQQARQAPYAGTPGGAPPGELDRSLRLRMEAAANEALADLEAGAAHLPTIVSISPFIGLLGTVWGVLQAFLNIGAAGSAELAVVAPGIAEALITTVAGLLVAIPAVFCNNYLISHLRVLGDKIEALIAELHIYFLRYAHYEKSKSNI